MFPLLAQAAAHELRAPQNAAAHWAFAALALTALPNIPVLWLSQTQTAYPPGLAWLGLNPANCLFGQTRTDAETLAALETALRGGMAGVAECETLSRLAARRVALAAKTGGAIGFLLRHAPAFTATDSNAFATRWLITPAPHNRLRAELLYAKNGRPGVFFHDLEETTNAPSALPLPAPEPIRAAG